MAMTAIVVNDIDGTKGEGIVTHRLGLGSDFYDGELCPQNLMRKLNGAGRRIRDRLYSDARQ